MDYLFFSEGLMKRLYVLLLIICLLSLTGCLPSQRAADNLPPEPPPPTVQPDIKHAEFEVGPLAIRPDGPMIGDSITVTTVVSNVGDISGSYIAVLTINGEEIDTKDVSIAAKDDEEVSFQIAGAAAGSHEIAVGKSSVVIMVYDWAPYTIQYYKGLADWLCRTSQPTICCASEEMGQIVHFTPQAKPFKIQKIGIFGQAKIEHQRELYQRHFTVRIWNNDKSEQLWSQDFPWHLFTGMMSWIEIEVPHIRVDDDFHVEIVSYSDAGNSADNYLFIAFELAQEKLPPPQSLEYYRKSACEARSGWSYMGQPVEVPAKYQSLNWFVRVEGKGPRL